VRCCQSNGGPRSARRSVRRRGWWLRTGSWFTLPAYATTAAARARARPGAARPPARADRPGQAAVPARYGRNRRWRVNPFPHCEGSPSITFLRVPWRRRGCNSSQLPGSLYRAASPASGPPPGFRHVHSGKMLALTVRSRRELEVICRGTGGVRDAVAASPKRAMRPSGWGVGPPIGVETAGTADAGGAAGGGHRAPFRRSSVRRKK
jgi:hypothetical protein